MVSDVLHDVLTVLRDSPILDAGQRRALDDDLAARFPDPRQLARELVQRNWLTGFQANRLAQGRAQELLLGPYVLLDRLGKGGMGEVFKARHPLMNRIVAVKVIRPDLVSHPSALDRFQREIQAAALLPPHPHVVVAYDAAAVGCTHFYVTEYVPGSDLHQLVSQHGPLPVAQACACARQAALGLEHAHAHGLVHRDVKPQNLLLDTRTGAVKVLDLGLARLLDPAPRQETVDEVTSAGALLGTPDYMAPEQAVDPHRADIRADLYSLGCTLYFLLTGQVPFPGGSVLDKLDRHRREEPAPLEKKRPDVPAALAVVVRRLLAKRPEDRYQTPAQAAAALEPFCAASEAVSASLPPPLPGKEASAPEQSGVRTAVIEEQTPLLAAPPRHGRRFVLAGIAAAVVVLVGGLLVIRPWSRRHQPPPPPQAQADEKRPPPAEEKPVVPPQQSPKDPPAKPPENPSAQPPVAWNKDVRAILDHVLPRGVESQIGRNLYGEAIDCLDRRVDNHWFVGSGLTRDGTAQRLWLRNGRLWASALEDEAVRNLGLEPRGVGGSSFTSELPIHGGELVTLEAPQLRLERGQDGNLLVTGRVSCRGLGEQRVEDLVLMLRRVYRKADHSWTKMEFQQLDQTKVPTGSLVVKVTLPDSSSLPLIAQRAAPDEELELVLQGFVYHPRPGRYQISNVLVLTESGKSLVLIPDRQDGWNPKMRALVEATVRNGLDDAVGRRVYGDLVAVTEARGSGSWALGRSLTRDGKAWALKVVAGKLTTTTLSEEEAKVQGVKPDSFHRSASGSLRLGRQPLAALTQDELDLKDGAAGASRLLGRVLCEPAGQRSLRDLYLVIAHQAQKEGAAGGKIHNQRSHQSLEGTKAPSGWIAVDQELPGRPDGAIGLYLEAWLIWPRPGFYRISNILSISPGKKALP